MTAPPLSSGRQVASRVLDRIIGQALALEYRMRDAHLKGEAPAHERRTRRRTGRTDMKIRKASGLCVQLVQMRRPQQSIAHTGEITLPLVISQDKDNIRATARQGIRLRFRLIDTLAAKQ